MRPFIAMVTQGNVCLHLFTGLLMFPLTAAEIYGAILSTSVNARADRTIIIAGRRESGLEIIGARRLIQRLTRSH